MSLTYYAKAGSSSSVSESVTITLTNTDGIYAISPTTTKEVIAYNSTSGLCQAIHESFSCNQEEPKHSMIIRGNIGLRTPNTLTGVKNCSFELSFDKNSSSGTMTINNSSTITINGSGRFAYGCVRGISITSWTMTE